MNTKVQKALTRVFIISLFVVACFIGGILVVDLVMSYMVGRGDEAVVPDFRGIDIVEARRLAQEKDLTIDIADQRYSEELSADMVIQQVPGAGRKMKRTRPIQVITSLGPEMAQVPDLRGVPFAEAGELLRTAGLASGDVSRAHVADVNRDAVVLSRPRAGESVRKGVSITLLVSDGPRRADWIMPDVRGRTEGRARAVLGNLGLVTAVTRSSEQGGRPGIVVRQEPPPGGRVVEGDRVELVVAP